MSDEIKQVEAKVEGFVTTHKSILTYVVVALVLFLGGYGAGRYATPAKVVTTEKTETLQLNQELTKSLEQLKLQLVAIQDAQKNIKIHVETSTHKNADGSSDTKTVSDSSDQSTTHSQETKTETKVVTVEKKVVEYQDRIVEKTKTVTADRPQWGVQAGAGVQFLPGRSLEPIYMGQVDHRLPGVLSAFSAGLMGQGNSQGGAVLGVLRMEF